MNARWMLYSYDALGLGHVRRMLAIARAVLADRQDLSALLVTCSPQVEALALPQGLDYVKLPSARKVSNTRYVSRSLGVDADRLLRLRSKVLLEATRSFEPDLLLVDKSPLGLMGELRGSLEAMRERRCDSLLVLGWRDILDEPERTRAELSQSDSREALERWYDEIWVYGDPAVFDVRKAYGLSDRVAGRVRYLGYLVPRLEPARGDLTRAAMSHDGAPVALVTAGGGEDGDALLFCYLEAARRGLLPDGLRSLVVTGPFMPADAQGRLAAAAPDRVVVKSFFSGLERAIAAADIVVAMAGYNTACELLGAGTPAVMVPRVERRQEQRIRSRRLAALGLVEHLEPQLLTPVLLAEAVSRALKRGRKPCTGLRCDGLDQVALHMRRLLPPGSDAVSRSPEAAASFTAGSAGEGAA